MKKNPNNNIFQPIAERWFLTEPALFSVYCTHRIVANGALSCTIRTGRGSIEYNPAAVGAMSESRQEEVLRAEMIRILLKHPYERKPFNCSNVACTLGSDCTLSSYYVWKNALFARPADFHLPERKHYEWYALEIEKLMNQDASVDAASDSQDSDGGTSKSQDSDGDASDNQASDRQDGDEEVETEEKDGGDDAEGQSQDSTPDIADGQRSSLGEQSELWQEDSLFQTTINDIIENTTSWGTLPGNIVEYIIASTQARIDYRKVLSGFRASIISSRRALTRMRPNRRTEFQNMGSLFRFRTNLLVGIDVSASVDSRTLAHVYSVVNRFFKYGIENIDVVQFDCDLGPVRNLKRVTRTIEVTGRGGTDFQPVVDFACSQNYDGLVIFTDGYAPVPVVPVHSRTRLLWVCQDDETFKAHHQWMEKIGRVCVIYK